MPIELRRGRRRQGLSLLEILVATAILLVTLVPFFALSSPEEIGIGPRLSSANYLFRDAVTRVIRLPPKQFDELLAAAEDGPNEFKQLDWKSLGVEETTTDTRRLEVGTLDARIYVRVLREVLGQFALDRVDFVLAYNDSRSERYLTRTVIRRNLAELRALGALRYYSSLEKMDATRASERIQSLLEDEAMLETARRDPRSKFLFPVYPERLRRFEPVRTDEAGLEAALAEADTLAAPAVALRVYPNTSIRKMPRIPDSVGILD